VLGFDVSTLVRDQQPAGIWAAALLHALARDEAAGRRQRRLTEPLLATWTRFRGRLTSLDLVAILFEDAAVSHPVPFDASKIGGPRLDLLSDLRTDAWLRSIDLIELDGKGDEYVIAQARLLGLRFRMGKSELHAIRPHQRVLELPGTGGQLAYHLVSRRRELSLHTNFVIACSSWREQTLAGIVGLELAAPNSEFIVRAEASDLSDPSHHLRGTLFDFVVGLHPDKGGLFRVEDQLAIWFPNAKVILV
jgi:hypothetical protein